MLCVAFSSCPLLFQFLRRTQTSLHYAGLYALQAGGPSADRPKSLPTPRCQAAPPWLSILKGQDSSPPFVAVPRPLLPPLCLPSRTMDSRPTFICPYLHSWLVYGFCSRHKIPVAHPPCSTVLLFCSRQRCYHCRPPYNRSHRSISSVVHCFCAHDPVVPCTLPPLIRYVDV